MMDNDAPSIAEYQLIARKLREAPPPELDRLAVIEQYLSQTMLLLGGMQGGGSFRHLNAQFNEALAPFRAPVVNHTFLDYFSGSGPLATYFKDEANFEVNPDATTADTEEALACFRQMAAHGQVFNQFPYQAQTELAQLVNMLGELAKSAQSFIPHHLNHCGIHGGLAMALTQPDWRDQMKAYSSGYYEDRSRPFNPDGSVPWVLFLKKLVSVKGAFYTVTMVMTQQSGAQIFVYHHYEDAWVAWDGVTLLPGMVQALCEELAWAKMLTATNESADDWFNTTVDDICTKSRSYAWQHSVLPSYLLFSHEASGQAGEFADFMHVKDSCRMTVKVKDAWMLVYGSYVNNNWEFTARFTYPQQSESMIAIPIAVEKLTPTQKRVLTQRAYRALGLKRAAIELEQQKIQPMKESA